MNLSSLIMPWAPASRAYCLPGSVILKLALGEAPESIPAAIDVRRGRLAAAQSLDGGVVDRIVGHFAGGMRITRVHGAAASLNQSGARHRGFDDRLGHLHPGIVDQRVEGGGKGVGLVKDAFQVGRVGNIRLDEQAVSREALAKRVAIHADHAPAVLSEQRHAGPANAPRRPCN